MLGFVVVRLSVRYVGLCRRTTVSPICWALWSYDCQSDMLGFVVVRLSVRYVGLCGRTTVSPICWALWSYDCQSDMLGFVVVGLSVGEYPTGSGGSNSSQGHPLPQRRTDALSKPSDPSPGNWSKLDEIIFLLQTQQREIATLKSEVETV